MAVVFATISVNVAQSLAVHVVPACMSTGGGGLPAQ